MDNKPPIDLDAKPDPMLARQRDTSNVNMPGKSKKYASLLVGFLVVILLIGLLIAAIYLMRENLPEIVQEYLPEDLKVPYLNEAARNG